LYLSRRELNKAKALAQQEDVPRPSNQLKQRSSSKSGKKRVSQEGKSNNLEARFLKAKETPVKNTIGEFDFDEDNDDDGEAPKGGKMKGKQVQSSSTSKGDFHSSCFLLGTTHSFFTFSIGWHPKKKKFAYARNLRNGGSLF
jgi:hypothetical protein